MIAPPVVRSEPSAVDAVMGASKVASAIAAPFAPMPTLTPNASAEIFAEETASTSRLPVIVKVFSASVAETVTFGCASATAPATPTPTPPATASANVVMTMSEIARIVMLLTSPMTTVPIDAIVSLVMLGRASAMPVENAPVVIPRPSVFTVRLVTASTVSVPCTIGKDALSMTRAFCELRSLRTATCAPTATKPPAPANAKMLESSCMPAWIRTSPPAEMLAIPLTRASVALRTVATSTAAPTPTKPPAAEPTRPLKLRPSSARR